VKFKNSSKFNNEQGLALFTERFDTGLKATFSDNNKQQFVKFCSSWDDDASCGVKGGRFTLPG